MFLSFFLEVGFSFQSLVVKENAWCDFNFLEFVETCFVSYHVVYLWKCSTCIWKEFFKFCILLIWDERLCIYQLSPFHLRRFFNATISLLIFCFEDLSIFDSGVLESPTIIVLLSISFLKSSKIFFTYLGAPMLCSCTFITFMSS